ncbi:MAG: cysteine hydrolase [Pseudomonadota bacterium]
MLRFDPSDTALLAIDLQRAFCAPEGSVAGQGRDIGALERAAERSFELIAAARNAGIRIIWTRMMYAPDYSDGGILVHQLRTGLKQIGALRSGTDDIELLPDADVRDDDIIVDKNRYSAFIDTDLEQTLDELGVRNLLVCGVTTSMCVETTIRDASQRDFMPYIIADACGELDQSRHDAALKVIEYGFGRVLSLGEATEALQTTAAAE